MSLDSLNNNGENYCSEEITERLDEVYGAEQETLDPGILRLQVGSLQKDEG